MAKQAVLLIAFENFRDEEYAQPKQILEQAGIEVTTASTQLGLARGKLGLQTKTEILMKDVNVADYDAIIFIGGPGCYNFFDDPIAQKIAKDAVVQQKVLAGICAAVAILAKAEVLKGVTATCFAGVADILKDKGGHYSPSGLEVDGRIVTADGPATAKGFGKEIVKLLNGQL